MYRLSHTSILSRDAPSPVVRKPSVPLAVGREQTIWQPECTSKRMPVRNIILPLPKVETMKESLETAGLERVTMVTQTMADTAPILEVPGGRTGIGVHCTGTS